MKKVKVCSLFSGIGGFETGLFNAWGEENVQVVFSSEIDAYASKGYEAVYGIKPQGDITKIAASDIPDHDILVGGFPCQAFSMAGKRKGFEDTRGTLFFEIARIVEEKKPKLLLLENVKGLLTHDKGNTFEVIMRTLGGLGYKVDYQLLNSKLHGSPQNRERVFIVASKGGEEQPWDLEELSGTLLKTKERLSSFPEIRTFNFPFPLPDEVKKRLLDVLEENVEGHLYLDKGKEKEILQRIERRKKVESIKETGSIKLVFLTGATDKPNWLDNGKELSRNYKQGSRIYDAKGISTTLSAQGVGGIGGHTGLYLMPNGCIRRLSPLECFRIQGFPDTYIHRMKEEEISDTQLYKMAGNAVTVNVVEAIANHLKRYL